MSVSVDDNIIVTAVICTYNRAPYLRKAIWSLCGQTYPSDKYEIVVVDNNSTDNTAQVVEEFSDRFRLRYAFESVQGLCQARNTGASLAKGKYVAYLDDDGIACPGWVEAVATSFERAKQPVGCVGGAIELLWELPRPDWLPDGLLCYFAELGYEEPYKFLDETTEYVGGGNSAYPVDLLKSMGGFDVSMGHKGKQIRYSEEVLLHRFMQRQGYGLLYNADMRIQHHVGAEKLNYEWLKRRMFWQGYSNVQTERRLGMLPMRPCPGLAWKTLRPWLKQWKKSVQMLNGDESTLSREIMEFRRIALYELGRAFGLCRTS